MSNTATHVPQQASDTTLTDTAFTIDPGTGDFRAPLGKRFVIEGDSTDSFIRSGAGDVGVGIECATGYEMTFANGVWSVGQVGQTPTATINSDGSASFGFGNCTINQSGGANFASSVTIGNIDLNSTGNASFANDAFVIDQYGAVTACNGLYTSDEIQFGSGSYIIDGSAYKSIDPNTRTLHASDGVATTLDYSSSANVKASVIGGTGSNSVAIGTNAAAAYQDGIAIGYNAVAYYHGIAIGSGATNMGDYYGYDSIAIGRNAEAINFGALAIGGYPYDIWGQPFNSPNFVPAVASENNAIAIGAGAEATAYNSVAIGTRVVNSTANTVKIGTNSETYLTLSAGGVTSFGSDVITFGNTNGAKAYIDSNGFASFGIGSGGPYLGGSGISMGSGAIDFTGTTAVLSGGGGVLNLGSSYCTVDNSGNLFPYSVSAADNIVIGSGGLISFGNSSGTKAWIDNNGAASFGSGELTIDQYGGITGGSYSSASLYAFHATNILNVGTKAYINSDGSAEFASGAVTINTSGALGVDILDIGTGTISETTTHQADSTATTLADLVTDFNLLLAYLQACGLMK
jgi:hypothetical protein